jgi:UDP:flavonoid glycosyltransferase YjiC (YdhE family)
MKIAVINTPFSTHIGRMEFVFSVLRDRGHEIELWGSGATKAIAERQDLTFRELPLTTDFAQVMQRRLQPHEIFTDLFFGIAREQLGTVLDYCDKYAPDVIEANARVFSATVASMLTGITVVTHCCSGNSFSQAPEDLYGFCIKGNESERQLSVMRRMSRQFFETTDTWFDENIAKPYGLGVIENAIGICAPEYAVAQTIRELSKARIASLTNVHLTGPIMSEGAADVDFDDYRPYCYVSLGTSPWNKAEIAARYRALIATIPHKFKIIIGLGGLLPAQAISTDDSRTVVFEQAPQLEAIKHAEFVVCHGGCQTVHEALYFGKPILGIPHHAEISEMVNSVELNGAGVRVSPSHLSNETLGLGIERVTAAETVANAERLAKLLQAADGQRNILELFESIARRPKI